ncbi:enolase-phosphatase E1-like isoform X2 [Wyeomyia smithii]|uniref:enolase-phosphatase E1-like isoform X2 n=1 Tax=Wyeomyia smithii TaxID=174621 RepID=UPI002467EBFF|nr:enolase-phosphatase E1-like isoform X2 [Wyeomyia smithii]
MKLLRTAIIATVLVTTLAFPTPQENSELDSSSGSLEAVKPAIKRVTKVEAEPVKQIEENNESTKKIAVDVAVPLVEKPTLLKVKETAETPSKVVKTDELEKADEIPKETVQADEKKIETIPEVQVAAEKDDVVAVVKATIENLPETDSSVKQPEKIKTKVEVEPTQNKFEPEITIAKEEADAPTSVDTSSSDVPADDEILKPVPIISFTEALKEYETALAKKKILEKTEELKPVATSDLKEVKETEPEKTEADLESLPKDKVEIESEQAMKKIPVAVVQDAAKPEDAKIETPVSSIKISEETKSEDIVKELPSVLQSTKPSKAQAAEASPVKLTGPTQALKTEPEVLEPAVKPVVPVKAQVSEASPVKLTGPTQASKKEPEVLEPAVKPVVPMKAPAATPVKLTGPTHALKTEPEVLKPAVKPVAVVVPSVVESQDSAKPANDETKLFIVEATQAETVEDLPKPAEPATILESEPQTKPKVEAVADEKPDLATAEVTAEKVEPEAPASVKVVKETEVKLTEVVKDEPVVEEQGSSTKTTTNGKVVKKGTEDKVDGDSSAAKSSEELKDEKEKVSDPSADESAPAPAKLESKNKGKKKLPGSNKKQNTI